MKAFSGQVRVLAGEQRGGQILRCILLLLGSGSRAETKGTWAGWTKGPTIIDHVRQELGMAGFDTFSKMLMLGLVENPEPPQHKSDQWRLTAAGKEAYAVVVEEQEGEASEPPSPADARRGKRKDKPKTVQAAPQEDE
jgi:hypothetical protein